MRKAVNNLRLENWRRLEAAYVLERLGCYCKVDNSFKPNQSLGSGRFHVNAEGRDFELLLTGPRFYDTRAQVGGGGAVDLVMHLYCLDFKLAVRKLLTVL